MPVSPVLEYGSLVNTASFPMVRPAAFAPISHPHIHAGRDRSTSAVREDWGIFR